MKMKLFICLMIILSFLVFSCKDKRNVVDIGTHPAEWSDPASEEFHGKAVLEDGTDGCKSCHEEDLSGGISGVSCKGSGCHAYYPHPAGFTEVSSADFHGQYIKNTLEWDMVACQNCHGEEYDREYNGTSCKSCHTGEEGPEECYTCHGSPSNNAPPRDLSKNVAHTALGVGAHQIHVAETEVARLLDCTRCHPSILSFDDPNHIDGDGVAEVIFDTLATDGGRLTSVWIREMVSCEDIYCHGSFRLGSNNQIRGNQGPVIWTEKNPASAKCEFCHSLPPAGHMGGGIYTDPQSCNQCHASVVNSEGEISNPTLHINRKPNFN
jgi:predicted CxxxxCH...CXXCH cytochrome family protein